MKRTIAVKFKRERDRSYRIEIEPGLIGSVPEFVTRTYARPSVYIITDSNVAKLYGRTLLHAFSRRDIPASLLDISPGEASKSAETVFALHTQLLQLGIRRDHVILALGGGVVGDVAGYVAATVLRGVRCIQVPTSLLAQIDSSVGGKVGIDHPLGKNLIGAFHQPSAVLIDPAVLRTLPEAEFRNGLAEMVKIAAALDKKFFAVLEGCAVRVHRSNPGVLAGLIATSVGLKAAVVSKDEFETGLRKTLNLGHTIGHAIESASGYSIAHGAAVAMGMVAEADISKAMGILSARDYQRLVHLIRALRLPTRPPRITGRKSFYSALAMDKKGLDRGARFVLLKAIGRPVIGVEVPTPFLEEALRFV